VGTLVAAGYLRAWYLAVERPTCTDTGVFACAGPALAMYVLGVPAAYVVLAVGLRVTGAPLPWLVPAVVLLALILLVPLSEPVDPPAWVWPPAVGLVCAGWTRLLPAARDGAR
jgi:hypothetical protein